MEALMIALDENEILKERVIELQALLSELTLQISKTNCVKKKRQRRKYSC